ncbi:MAG: ABC transporter ATP-binding protein [Kiritimatiellae bacterium]|nr:ABC transporter ATP-binding protein [Kiritimatiellia bacterium]
MALLEVENVAKEYRIPGQPPVPVLNGVSFSVDAGERVAITGRSGAGKTTLLNIIGGLDKPTSGKVKCTRNAGFVFQSFRLMPELTVLENVLLPSMAGVPGSKVANPKERAKKLLGKVGLLDRTEHLPAELSGGEQQRVALARALMCEPEIIFADEPTGNLDALTGADILDLLMGFGEKQFALVMVTHSAQAASRCDRTLHLECGRIVEP